MEADSPTQFFYFEAGDNGENDFFVDLLACIFFSCFIQIKPYFTRLNATCCNITVMNMYHHYKKLLPILEKNTKKSSPLHNVA
ncbi:MAG: hypothetical protein V5A68_07115 [Candidatus Thermoplasmatota archaeon]